MTTAQKLELTRAALGVLVLDDKISVWLTENDPMAYAQALDAFVVAGGEVPDPAAALARQWPEWKNNPTVPLRRDEVKPGMIVHSSHGYRLLITEVQDNAITRTDDRHVGFVGHLHADPACKLTTERYPAGSTILVEVA